MPIDWMNPSEEMLEGRDAGRQDRQNEIDDLLLENEHIEEQHNKAEASSAAWQKMAEDYAETIQKQRKEIDAYRETEGSWSENPPTERGYYWVQEYDFSPIKKAHVWEYGEFEICCNVEGGQALDVSKIHKWWSEPIYIPAPPTKDCK